ncbi:hypothetical protein GCM10027159_20850 [Lysobacter terrae]
MLEGFVLEQEELLVLLADPLHQVATARFDFVDAGTHGLGTVTRTREVLGPFALCIMAAWASATGLVQLLQRVARLFEQFVPGALRCESFEFCIDGGELVRKLVESRTRLRDPLVERTGGIRVLGSFEFHGVGIGHVVLPQPPAGALPPFSSTASDNLS